LRVTHTAAESISLTIREEDRRRSKRFASIRGKKGAQGASGLKPQRSIFGRRKRLSEVKTDSDAGHGGEPAAELSADARAELERARTTANAAVEAEESARRQERQDEKRSRWKRAAKPKGRRVVYVNVDGVLTHPKGYERNKVRTSKYTLITFLPKVSTDQENTYDAPR
jgi:phospholipid-translocating ATPase